jgi:hypothetical protein
VTVDRLSNRAVSVVKNGERKKICNVDESGTQEESPLVVMVGVVADCQRIARTRDEFPRTFEALGSLSSG